MKNKDVAVKLSIMDEDCELFIKSCSGSELLADIQYRQDDRCRRAIFLICVEPLFTLEEAKIELLQGCNTWEEAAIDNGWAKSTNAAESEHPAGSIPAP